MPPAEIIAIPPAAAGKGRLLPGWTRTRRDRLQAVRGVGDRGRSGPAPGAAGRAEDAIRPWSHRSWIFPRDPDLEPQGRRVLDLYAR
jgi:hypothetical protein